ncbi:putative HTH-type transcriptional regulator YidP [Corynebacterium capitovis DSM 44611]|uniref:GntR family transcriptional regulator n=1 Tax=Corynebacterium capitovis TaxID=131081 RepID=UPI0003826AAA|nr:GntR family transcriptional regulator [Corynebacterium capitovis]WKD57149.1 putative HTH-type transcriptional regulator YidP [Corynebacterium capitovis DSM 44611]
MGRKPAYVAIAENLRTRITSEALRPGSRLPAERELVDEFGVARMTVRHALDLLQLEGIIERRRGRTGGTFVRALPPVVDLGAHSGLVRQLTGLGKRIHTAPIASELAVPPRRVAAEFQLGPHELLSMRHVLHYADDVPAFAETTYARPGCCSVDEGEQGGALCDGTLAAAAQPGKRRREDTLNPGVATDAEREDLRLAVNAPVQRITRRVFEGDELISFSVLVVRADAAQLRVVCAV